MLRFQRVLDSEMIKSIAFDFCAYSISQERNRE